MAMGFSGEPITKWDGYRNMVLEEDFYFIDGKGKKWEAPKGSLINGATIPRALWSTVGAPYSGPYRRASVIHDVAVGELTNPEATDEEKKAADRMFYSACRYDGCSRRLAAVLYIGARMGSWITSSSALRRVMLYEIREEVGEAPEDIYLVLKFKNISAKAEATIESDNPELLDAVIDQELGIIKRE